MMKFRIFGIEIYVSFVVVALFSVLLLLDINKNLIFCFISAFLHEAGHLLAMCRCNCKPSKIIIKLFDIRIIDNKRLYCPFKCNIIIILSGVAVNFFLTVCFFIIYFFTEAEYCKTFSLVNFFTGAFNLLPASNLDGGQALYLVLMRKFSEETTERVIDGLTIALILPTAICGFIVLFRSKYNFSLLFISFYLVLALVLKKSKFY